ncbi:MAG: type II secretion system protein GspM [Gammaproteobacteria bacterium]|nr:type II secretion system protein GspM [Gammaproteobacteria bacterium]
MKLWFSQLVPREQKWVLMGGSLLLLTLIYLLLIEPALLAREQRQNSVKALQQELLWMQQSQQEALSLGAGQTNSGTRSNGQAPYIIVDAAIRRARLGTPERIDPQGKKGTKVQFAQVDFNQLMNMLADLELNHGLRVISANISKMQAGKVNARISVERGDK